MHDKKQISDETLEAVNGGQTETNLAKKDDGLEKPKPTKIEVTAMPNITEPNIIKTTTGKDLRHE